MTACAALAAWTVPVKAQLSSDDIAALRARGEAEGWTFTVGENDATKWPLDRLCGAVEPPDWRKTGRFDPCTPRRMLPASFDWRPFGACTPIRDQGGCGSCWAFGAMGSVESYLMLVGNLNRDLSEQWLVSCTTAGTCNGGWHTTSFQYLECGGLQDPCGHSGAVLDSDFPYAAEDLPCGCPYPHPYCIPGWAFVGSPWQIPSVEQLKEAILTHGPISVCVYVNDAFQAYFEGVFNACDEEHDINHVVVLVGWDDDQGPNGVWLMRNSWGNWGEDGYMRITYGCCRIGYAACLVDYLAEAGAATVPLTDDFASMTLNRSKWTGVSGAEVSDVGLNEPSGPYALNLDGSAAGGDSARTAKIASIGWGDVVVQYKYQRTGGGDSPESGDDLVVEYFSSNLEWVELARYPGGGADMTSFVPASHTITAADVFHSAFRVQFRVESPQSDADDWFIDDVYVSTNTDLWPPEPSPMTWQSVPAPASTTSITMTAAEATDGTPPVLYYFYTSPSGGGHSRDWAPERTYVDTGLTPNKTYTYVVRARDSVVPYHTTLWSISRSTATWIQTPTDLAAGTVTTNSIELVATGPFANLSVGQSGLYFQCQQTGASSGWIKNTTWTAGDLQPGTEYTFTVKARNQGGVETPSIQATFWTVPGQPLCSLPGDVNDDGIVDGQDIASFVRVKLGVPEPGDKSACANYGGSLEEDGAQFIGYLLGA